MYKIMLVEDEAIIRRGIKRGVKWEENGFEIAAEAEDGEEALKLLEETGGVYISPIPDGIVPADVE